MVDGKENYKFDQGVKGSNKCSINPFTCLICLFFAIQSFNFLLSIPPSIMRPTHHSNARIPVSYKPSPFSPICLSIPIQSLDFLINQPPFIFWSLYD